MSKKLPNLYVNKIEKKLENNDKIFYSAIMKKPDVQLTSNIPNISFIEEEDIEDKINSLFNSPNYVYKMGVDITLNDNTVIKKEVIGLIDNNLVTIDEDLIPVSSIRDIKF